MGKASRVGKAVHQKRERQVAKVIHTQKLFGGVETAQDVHRRLAWGPDAVCACGDRSVVVQINSHASPRDLVERLRPDMLARLMLHTEDGQLPTWQSKYGPMVHFGKVWACETHKGTAERAAARLPSWILVDIDHGPGADKTVVQVPRVWRDLAQA